MKSLYESLLDNIDVRRDAVVAHSIIDQLQDNGVEWANDDNTVTEEDLKNIVSCKNGELRFFNEEKKIGTHVFIDYNKAWDFLRKSKIKTILAPAINIYNAGDLDGIKLNSGNIYIRVEKGKLKNLNTIDDISFDGYVVFKNKYGLQYTRFPSRVFDFVKDPAFLYSLRPHYVRLFCDEVSFNIENCSFMGDYNNSLSLACTDFNFKNVKSNFEYINCYDKFFWDGNMKRKMKNFLNEDGSFTCWTDVTRSVTKERKRNFRSTIAYFNNRKLVDPKASPYIIQGTTKDLFGDISGFTSLKYVDIQDSEVGLRIAKEENNYALILIFKKFYRPQGEIRPIIPETKDGYKAVFYKTH